VINIPNRVRIGPHTLKVEVVDVVPPATGAEGEPDKTPEEQRMGRCSVVESVIHLRKSLSTSRLQEVFLHECIHAFDDMMGINLSEQQVAALGNALLMLVLDNPEVFDGRRAGAGSGSGVAGSARKNGAQQPKAVS
jgi:hypothetical protein